MFIVSRRVGEEIVIEIDGIILTITIIEIRGDKVRIGVQGPPDVPIRRLETTLE